MYASLAKWILLLNLVAVNDVISSEPSVSQHLPLRSVEVFQRAATFVAKDRQIRILNVNLPGEPMPLFKVAWLGDLNCPIALAKEGDQVIVTDGNAIFSISTNGKPNKLCALDELQYDRMDEQFTQRMIKWYLATSRNRDVLFFAVENDDRQGLYRLELQTKKVLRLDFPSAGIDVDTDCDIAYGSGHPKHRHVLTKDFDGKIDRTFPTSMAYYFCRLAEDKSTLLLSDIDLQKDSPIALLNLSTGQETKLPVTGSHATWYARDTILFLRGSNSLWQFRIGDPNPAEMLSVPGKAMPGYSIMPHLSTDKTWLAWGWTSKTRDGFRNGTILIDLRHNEYRQLKGWWYNVQWLQDGVEAK